MSERTGYMYLWEYEVRPEHVPAFLAAYGPDGDWARLFRQSAGYVRTELHRDRSAVHRFVTIDYWESEEDWADFRRIRAAEFESLDGRCEAYTESEREIGRFEPARG